MGTESHYESQTGFSPQNSSDRTRYSSKLTPRRTELGCSDEGECCSFLHRAAVSRELPDPQWVRGGCSELGTVLPEPRAQGVCDQHMWQQGRNSVSGQRQEHTSRRAPPIRSDPNPTVVLPLCSASLCALPLLPSPRHNICIGAGDSYRTRSRWWAGKGLLTMHRTVTKGKVWRSAHQFKPKASLSL